MGKDHGSWLHQKYSLLKSPGLNFASALPYLGQQKPFQPFTNPYNCMVSANGTLPGLALPIVTHLKGSDGIDERQPRLFQQYIKPLPCMVSAHGSLQGLEVPGLSHSWNSKGEWFYSLPYRYNSGTAIPDAVLKKKLPTPITCGIEATSSSTRGSVQKRFLVFDHSGNKTKLIFSSSIAAPLQRVNIGKAAPIETCGLEQNESRPKGDLIAHPWPVIYDELDEVQKSREETEMHEDTEELDALLYSNDSDYDDEETSTAHSPSEITGWCKVQEEIEETAGEVTSPMGVTKRKRLADEEDEQSLLQDTANSSSLSKCEDDAESSCVNARTQGKPYSFQSNKRFKRERIWDTVSTLQSIIPGGKSKDTVLILDGAVQYLRFLKLKAESYGFATE